MKKTILTLAVSLTCAGAWATPVLDPTSGHYYDVISAPHITWEAARDAALLSFYAGLEGHLATITSAGEHSYVNLAIQLNGGGEMWAGGYQNPVTETDRYTGWTWVNGEGTFPGVNSTSPYASWNGGEPNDYYGTASEQYLGLNLGPGFNDEGNLNNITGYVIEYDPNTIRPTPESGATASMLGGALVLLASISRRLRK